MKILEFAVHSFLSQNSNLSILSSVMGKVRVSLLSEMEGVSDADVRKMSILFVDCEGVETVVQALLALFQLKRVPISYQVCADSNILC